MAKRMVIILIILFASSFVFAQSAIEEINKQESITLNLKDDFSFVETLYYSSKDKTVVYEGTYCFESGKLILNAETPVVRQFVFDYVISSPDGSNILEISWESNSIQLHRNEHTADTVNAEHIWGEAIETKAPTCTERGEKYYTCIICGKASDNYGIAEKGHSKVDGVCTVCGSSGPYWIDNAGSLKVDYSSILPSVVEIPEIVDGKTVKSIRNYAFQNCTELISVSFPNSVTSFGYDIFRNCPNLTIIVIPNSLSKISNSTFKSCESLVTVVYTGTIEQWTALEKADGWNSNIPATVVNCSDGDVTL